ncbi:N-acetylglucosamine-1-phosphate uridyltransferase [Bosea thiooxidans]|uniref:Glycine/D-amino acid oxidase n=1 Tax=Bosea thiooxidans TaxID=53254 RepID=A0A0Q3I5N8_9HYPH|nr:FAD-dependent oxidoreductase [Bosea thiooxidans]KQK30295.1 N-acetylglucosamine-1-phosphate uridyltransferase [Bosea thiooxidans]SKC05637.1 Glycine/D-amino acid oxidase [Bosea thiooxidans]
MTLDPQATRQNDLRSGAGPWHAGLPRPPGRPLERDLRCDVAIVGSGITGALVAEHLSAMGLDVVLIDREREGFGSTAASTAMLQWEIDLPLRRLAALYGFASATDIYRLSVAAVDGLAQLVAALALPCGFARRRTVYLAAGEAGPRELRDEADLRERAGLPGSFVEHAALRDAFGFDRQAAIVSPGSAEADPLSLCHALLAVAAQRGTRLIRDEAVGFDGAGRSAAVSLAGGHVVEASHVVLATGYVMPDIVQDDLHRVSSSWAIATLPQPAQALWPERALVWEASEDYCYCRSTADGRIVFGGEDEEVDDPDRREALALQKTQALLRRLHALVPRAVLDLGRAWSGAFGQTADGLPLIGRVPGRPRLLAAYGYGGNGITFSFLASRMIGRLVSGGEERWFRHFAIDRPCPG